MDKKFRSILDVGCGSGYPMKLLNMRKKLFSVGLDIYIPYIKDIKRQSIHDDYIVCDIRFLPIKPKTFDTVLCALVIEHLYKKDGWKLLYDLEKIARRQIIITTYNGFMSRGEIEGVASERHLSGWKDVDFIKLGYQVKKSGLKFFFDNGGLVHIKPHSFLSRFIIALDPLFELFFNFIPLADYHLICKKKILLNNNGA